MKNKKNTKYIKSQLNQMEMNGKDLFRFYKTGFTILIDQD